MHDVEAAVAMLDARPMIALQWRVKRAFGMAGRGQRRIAPGVVSEADRAFLRSAIASEGGVMIEPDVMIVRELGLHGLLAEDGAFCLGRQVTQECDAHGQWLATTLAEDVDVTTREAITSEARRVAAALHAAGYWGPFGIDAFLIETPPTARCVSSRGARSTRAIRWGLPSASTATWREARSRLARRIRALARRAAVTIARDAAL